jgi:hypothetical protein
MLLPATADRVTRNTAEAINERIRRDMEARVAQLADRGPEALEQRLAELDEEWDIERAVETLAPSLTLTGLLLAALGSRKWLILSAVVQGFFLQHALQGWCPPVPILRRLGVRTYSEIEEERTALKALRGDFKAIRPSAARGAARRALDAARR